MQNEAKTDGTCPLFDTLNSCSGVRKQLCDVLCEGRTAKGAKLREIPLYHSSGGSNAQSQKRQWKNTAEVASLTCCKALRKLFSRAGGWQGTQQHGHFMPVFADNVAWYFKICINGNPLNKKKKSNENWTYSNHIISMPR